MLVSSSNPSLGGHSRMRSKSMDGLDGVLGMAGSQSTPSLLLSSSPVRRARFPSFGDSKDFHDSFHHSVSLAKVSEESTLEAADIARKKKEVSSELEKGWDLKDVWEWYDGLPWLAGMNYLPRTAVNFVEMWDETSFDPETINEELAWAADKLGYNTLRTNIPMVLYEHDVEGLTRRINKFLRIAAKNGFAVMLCPLDDCEFSGKEAKPGPQPEPTPGLHNSQAIGSPGRHIVLDESQWYRVEEYIRYVVRTWGQDKRIFLLDLYNEPGNPWTFHPGGTKVIPEVEKFEKNALLLMEKVFQWARDEKPTQPLTVSAWHMPDPFFDSKIIPLTHEIDQRAMELSDVISVHAYCDPACLQATLSEITFHGKPILLTEWMARQVQSTYESAFPTLKELKVGAYQWGLVKGKTQTHLPWPHVAHQYDGDQMWWHDVLDADGTFHNEQEGEVIRSFVHPQIKALSAEVFLIDSESTEGLDEMHQHVSLSQLHHHVDSMPEHSFAEIPVINEGEEVVIPSVCSISMATINAVAAAQAAELAENEEISSYGHRTKSAPTFGKHMSTPSMEALDLDIGGIEF